MINKRSQRKMDYLLRLLDAGEKGYAISALNLNNRGLKALFKSYAKQRSRFKDELLAEMERFGMGAKPRSSVAAALHRGQINIFTALAIGQEQKEQVVLKEILFGEKIALRSYDRLLSEKLHPDMIHLISRQRLEIHRIVDQLQFMRGKEGNRMVLRLFDTDREFETALKNLIDSGLRLQAVIWMNFNDIIELYEGGASLALETIFAGVVGGALFGSLIGALSGIGMQVAGIASGGMLMWQGIWSFLAFAGLIVGGMVGALLGFVISIGMANDDAYLYDQSLKRGKIILMTIVDTLRAAEAGRIMAAVNARARTHAD